LLRRQPAVVVAIAITAALLGLACAALPLYLASASSAAVSNQVHGICPSQLGDDASGFGPISGLTQSLGALQHRADSALVAAGANADDLGPARVTMFDSALSVASTVAPGKTSNAQLATSTDGLSNISVVSSAGGPGVWLSSDVASSLGVKPGQRVTLAGTKAPGVTGPSTVVRVAGTYESLVGTSLPQFWCTQTGLFGTPDSNAPPPPVILTDQPTFLRLLPAIGSHSVPSFEWQRFFLGNRTLPQARRVAHGAKTFALRIGISDQEFGSPQPRRIGGGFRVSTSLPVQLAAVVTHAGAVEHSLRGSIGPVSLSGAVVALLLVGLAGSYWVDRRRIEVQLLGIRGVGPVAIGIKAALETLVPVAIGSAIGWLVGLALMPTLGPSGRVQGQAKIQALELVGLGALAGIVLVAVVAAARTRGLLERPVGHAPPAWTKFPVELLGLAGALWAWRSIGTVSLQASGSQAPRVPAAMLVFPLLFLLSTAALTGRLAAAVLRTGRPARATTHSSPAVWLAVRRLAGGAALVALLVLSTGASIGVLVYSSALSRSQRATLDAKAEIFVGSKVSALTVGHVTIPPELANVTTQVALVNSAQVGAAPVEVIGVDPATFERAAFWNSSFSSHSLHSLLATLDAASSSTHDLAVLETDGDTGIGDVLTDTQILGVGQIRLHVIERTSTFPGEDGGEPLLVTTKADLARLPLRSAPELWVRGDKAQVLNDLNRVGDQAPIVVATSDVIGVTTFAAVTWTFAYLQAFGVLIGIVTVGGLLLFLTTRARSRGLAYSMSRRMGLRRRQHVASLAAELGVVIGLGAVAGGGWGWLAVEMAARHLNALPGLPPAALVEVPVATLAGAAAALVAVWLVATGWAQYVTDRVRPSEVLRLDA
jgi:putative ABC transport system permease protein